MSIPREVWISEETALLQITKEVVAISSVGVAETVVTIGVSGRGHGLIVGDQVAVVAVNNPAVNGSYFVNSIVDAGHFTYLENTLNITATGDTGTVTPTLPLRTEVFTQHLTITPKNEVKKQGQPGATSKDTNVIPDGNEVQLTAYYTKKLTQWAPYLNTATKYKFELSLINYQYDGQQSDNNENDDHVIRNCSITGQKITWEDDKVIEVAITLDGEYEL